VRRGTATVAADCARWALGFLLGRHLRPVRFRLGGSEYTALHHRHLFTWLNERAVEVPVFAGLVASEEPGSVLEVGNVLSHYGFAGHDVVDKYEHAPGVLNADAADLELDRRYQLIVSVSTLEHLGLDERPLEPDKPKRALGRLRSLLAPGGRLVFSVPVGYNPHLDRYLRSEEAGLADCGALRRDGRHWRETDCSQAWDIPYDRLLYRAGAVVIGTVRG